MGTVIQMATARNNHDTKRETYEHGGQKYTCAFDKNAPPGKQWVWYVDYVVTHRYVGSAPTMEKASIDARKKIHALNTLEDMR